MGKVKTESEKNNVSENQEQNGRWGEKKGE